MSNKEMFRVLVMLVDAEPIVKGETPYGHYLEDLRVMGFSTVDSDGNYISTNEGRSMATKWRRLLIREAQLQSRKEPLN